MVRSLFSRPSDVRRVVKTRGLYSHKGDFGYLLIVGGSDVYSGAPALTGMAALRTGVGLALIAAPREVAGTIRSYSPDLIVHSLTGSVVMGHDVNAITQLLAKADAVVLGPGIGLDPRTERVIPEIVRITTAMSKPLLIDADAIRAIRSRIELLGQAGTVVTPHAGEFKFISGMDAPSKWRERVPIFFVDLSVLQAFESKILELHDFYFTGDDYRYRFESDARQRFIDIIRERFNAGAARNGRTLKWDTIIEQKTNELGRFLIGKSPTLNLDEPAPKLEKRYDREIRARILALTSSEANSLGIGASTLHYLRKNAQGPRSFRIYEPVHSRLIASSRVVG